MVPVVYHCKICGVLLVPRDVEPESAPLKDRRLCLHHIDYQKNIAIRVCPECHVKLHNSLKNHEFGVKNVVRRDGTKRGPLTPGRYPKKILD